jgi:hypothetical protein
MLHYSVAIQIAWSINQKGLSTHFICMYQKKRYLFGFASVCIGLILVHGLNGVG